MTDADRKRLYVADLYPGSSWKKKVSRMPDDQVTAIYLKHQRDGEPPEHTEPEPEPQPEPKPLVDVPRVTHGPHANEDDFHIY